MSNIVVTRHSHDLQDLTPEEQREFARVLALDTGRDAGKILRGLREKEAE